MLLWINGPFGGGKTQTAYEIQRRLSRSVVCDPGHAGFGLRRMMPPYLRHDDFAEHIWTDRLTVPQVADRIAASAGLTLAPNTDSALRARARRTWITIKHVRFG